MENFRPLAPTSQKNIWTTAIQPSWSRVFSYVVKQNHSIEKRWKIHKAVREPYFLAFAWPKSLKKKIVGILAYNNTCIWNQFSAAWLPAAVWWWEESLLQESLQQCLWVGWESWSCCSAQFSSGSWSYVTTWLSPQQTALKYLNYMWKSSYVTISVAAGTIPSISNCLIYVHVSVLQQKQPGHLQVALARNYTSQHTNCCLGKISSTAWNSHLDSSWHNPGTMLCCGGAILSTRIIKPVLCLKPACCLTEANDWLQGSWLPRELMSEVCTEAQPWCPATPSL